MTVEEQEKGSKYFNVEKFREIYSRAIKPRGRLGRTVGRVTGALDSMQGLLIMLMFIPILFGTVLAVTLGAYYGPLGFIGILGAVIGGLAFYADRKVGRSMQFGEYNFLTRTVATGAAFLLILGLIFFLVFASKL